jgi:hypothetical protein
MSVTDGQRQSGGLDVEEGLDLGRMHDRGDAGERKNSDEESFETRARGVFLAAWDFGRRII